jgi:hypothetical protein
VTRLVESDVRLLTARLDLVEKDIMQVTGLDFVGIAARACGVGGGGGAGRPPPATATGNRELL